jgi:hypothetical protein
MNAVVKWCLTRLAPGVVLCAALGGGAWWLHHAGYSAGEAAAATTAARDMAEARTAWAQERQEMAQQSQAAILAVRQQEQVQRERADNLASQLAEKTSELAQAKHLLSINVAKAISNDNNSGTAPAGSGYNGIGPDSLQLYERALGYSRGNTGAGDSAGQ